MLQGGQGLIPNPKERLEFAWKNRTSLLTPIKWEDSKVCPHLLLPHLPPQALSLKVGLELGFPCFPRDPTVLYLSPHNSETKLKLELPLSCRFLEDGEEGATCFWKVFTHVELDWPLGQQLPA